MARGARLLLARRRRSRRGGLPRLRPLAVDPSLVVARSARAVPRPPVGGVSNPVRPCTRSFRGRRRRRCVGAVVDCCGVSLRHRRGSRRNRARRRLPGQPRPAPASAIRRRAACIGSASGAASSTPSRCVRHGGLGRRLRVARALPRTPRRPDPDDADQGNAAAGTCGRAARVGEGHRRAHDDRGPRAQRPLSRFRARERCIGPSSW